MEKWARKITENGIDYVLDKTTETYLPQLEIDNSITLGRYGRMRRDYLKKYNKPLYNSLSLACTLYEHCAEIEQTAIRYREHIIKGMAEAGGLTEEMKNTDMLRWVGLMNNYRACAEEFILNELIYDG